ncbi:hypothetical protein B0T26DRAFT_756772 [Lasiosphaeria miniovina]|uniref:Uncharacterized protein n=1 Tax=Lasiosphaeria miniovina TaxID=1954250 RepID=A0AA40DJ39_9PEZI|nr:uncharacterized protein B0T26DRAFT_756772 [Lasiosphaeria miniovina]KAK0703206.1 hypothetical protein B0T26DRAFT_756772 [Lasiosphaeria miniovina]
MFVANPGVTWEDGPMLDGKRKEGTTVDGQELGAGYRGGSFIATASMSGHVAKIPQLRRRIYRADDGAVLSSHPR